VVAPVAGQRKGGIAARGPGDHKGSPLQRAMWRISTSHIAAFAASAHVLVSPVKGGRTVAIIGAEAMT